MDGVLDSCADGTKRCGRRRRMINLVSSWLLCKARSFDGRRGDVTLPANKRSNGLHAEDVRLLLLS
jgi:hypothetical protein